MTFSSCTFHKKIFFSFILSLSFFSIYSQSDRAIFIGIQPAITVEPEYEKGEFDVNIIPLVFQSSLSKRVDYRIVSIVNYHFGPINQISDLGLEIGFPVFLKSKETILEPSSGIFVSPVISFGRNLLNEHYTLTLAAEPGYFFDFNSRFALSLQFQIGGSYFVYDAENENAWRTHFGFKANLGFWINKKKE